MKKQYLKPTTRVVKLKRCKILFSSPLVKDVYGAPDQIFWATGGIGEDEVLR